MEFSASQSHWLDRYGSEEYRWRNLDQCSKTIYYRPLGLVEYTFDADGRYFEGRADMNAQLDLEVKCLLSDEDLRERILFAWTCLRCKYVLLQAKAVSTKRLFGKETVAGSDMSFLVEAPRTVIQAVEEAGQYLTFLPDHFDHVDARDFWVHCHNTARVIEPERSLAKMFAYAMEATADGLYSLRFLKVSAHQIEDGLTTYTEAKYFIHCLNQTVPDLRKELRELLQPEGLAKRLPPPQEALYPPITGSRARQRWFWLLTRILRHVRKPLPAGFLNPLRRRHPRKTAVSLSPTYAPILDYSRTPPLNSIPCFLKVSLRNTERMHRICRDARASIGAGAFAMTALIMMEMYERREPDIPLSERRPFISGFPLNPRAFFNHHIPPDSLMLSFCDGIKLPFLPSDLDLEGRLRLLCRQAHRQLTAYQKRANPKQNDGGLQYMGSRGPGRLLAVQYLGSVERMETRLPEQYRTGVNPQGALPMRPNEVIQGFQTCGVSSVGRRDHMIKRGVYNLHHESKDFVADYRDVYAAVRPRDFEFLVGCGGGDSGFWVDGTIDGSSMDPALVEQWRQRFETLLDVEDGSREAKL